MLAVETLELPASATRLDNVLRLRSPQGQEYAHILEWQGYPDPGVLWRTSGYITWFGQREPSRAVVGTIIYLTPAADMGDTIEQRIDGEVVLTWQLPVVRLWELEAAAALAHGSVGMAVLSPLMRGADATSVEQAITLVQAQAPLPQRADLFYILGVFAEPLIDPARFERLIGKEILMNSTFLAYMMEEKLAEIAQQHAAALAEKEAALAAKDATLRYALQEAAEDAVVVRFPQTPAILTHYIRRISDPAQLKTLHTRVLYASDQAAVERILAEFAPRGEG